MRRSIQVVAGFLGILTLVSGCIAFAVGAAAGVGAYAWSKGSLERTFPSTTGKAHDAVVAALADDLDYTIVKDTPGQVKAKMPDDTGVDVKIKYVDIEITAVAVRVGVMGERTSSQVILDKISARLGYDK